MNNNDLQNIQNQIGYYFKNPDLLQQAFVRRSYARENGGEDNEVLEFIGDKVLDIVVVKILTEKFGFYTSECDDYDEDSDFDEFCCEYSEGELTEIKKQLVQKKTLAYRIDRLELADYLIMGRGDRHRHIENEDSVKEDLFEAIIGAVTLDSKWDWDEIQSVVEYMLNPDKYLSDGAEDNYIELIQDWARKKYGELLWIDVDDSPRYAGGCFGANFYLPPSNKLYYKGVLRLKDIGIEFNGYGISQNEARQDVCKRVYQYLQNNDWLSSIRDEIENPNKDDAINQLEILARRGYFSIPTYDFKQKYDSDGNPIWKCECHIKEYDIYFDAKSSSKKGAKKSAAFEMLEYVLSEEE